MNPLVFCLVCMAFALPIALSQPTSFLSFTLLVSLPYPAVWRTKQKAVS